jgi:hypothetical protein
MSIQASQCQLLMGIPVKCFQTFRVSRLLRSLVGSQLVAGSLHYILVTYNHQRIANSSPGCCPYPKPPTCCPIKPPAPQLYPKQAAHSRVVSYLKTLASDGCSYLKTLASDGCSYLKTLASTGCSYLKTLASDGCSYLNTSPVTSVLTSIPRQ